MTASIGAMAIVGAIQDGLMNDYSTLAVKSVLDFILIAVALLINAFKLSPLAFAFSWISSFLPFVTISVIL